MNPKKFSRSKLIFFGIAASAFSVSSVYFSQTVKFLQPGSGSDSYFYLQWAADILRGNFLGDDVFYAMPFYPYFLSLAFGLAKGKVFSLVLFQMFIGALNCGLIYVLGKELFGRRVGITAGFIACAYAMFIFYQRLLLPTSLAIFLGLLLALLLLRISEHPSAGKWLSAGFLLAICALTRASFFLSALFILFWMIYEYWKKNYFKMFLLYACCFILPFFLIIGAVTLRNYLVAADPVLITAHSGINFYIGNNSEADGLFKTPHYYMRPTQAGLIEDARIVAEKVKGRRLKPTEVSNFWLGESLKFIRTRPLSYLRLLGRKFALFWNGREYVDDIEYYIFRDDSEFLQRPLFRFSLIGPLSLVGILLSWPLRRKIAIVYLLTFSLMLATISFFINSRYRLIVAPYLIIFAAYGFWRTLAIYKNRQYKSLISSLILFIGFYFLTNIKMTNVVASDNYILYYNKGIYLTNQGEYQKAQQEFQTALVINPRDYMSYLALGNIDYHLRNFSQAMDSFRKSLAINPYFYEAHFNLGIIYSETGQQDAAVEEFEHVLKFNPNDYGAYYNLGKIYQEKGLNRQALEKYRQALKFAPNHPQIIQVIRELKETM